VNFSDGKEISFDLDWNNQSNGCYLTASLYLCPAVTDGNPGDENDWFKFEYVGVPPGRNARCVVAAKSHGKVEYLYTEGWPEQRTGRHIAYQRIKIILDDKNKSSKIIENEKEIYCSPSHGLEFTSAHRSPFHLTNKGSIRFKTGEEEWYRSQSNAPKNHGRKTRKENEAPGRKYMYCKHTVFIYVNGCLCLWR
jgi:hypothetical protein